ncbi:unnamed protein product [Protopolystoma xenopodis]|uniref:Amino acid permease/ SLC12A domain-containing protein n=1 Tax=Protopolystoma xenopodis TaxID=117903 RepID=A0A3S4ZUM8_9PLAT|nr:unnamed protein product [Protopolystoma xenopodis]
MSGASTCFYAFVGFDILSTTGEEARSAARSIPIATGLTLAVSCLLYLGVSTVLTLIAPFGSLTSSTPIAEAFDKIGLVWVKWVIGLGGVFGLSASLLGSLFPLPRILFAMAKDGLVFAVRHRLSEEAGYNRIHQEMWNFIRQWLPAVTLPASPEEMILITDGSELGER